MRDVFNITDDDGGANPEQDYACFLRRVREKKKEKEIKRERKTEKSDDHAILILTFVRRKIPHYTITPRYVSAVVVGVEND